MIPSNLEKIFEENDIQYYAIEEVGFSNKTLAIQNNLHEDFGDYYTSTYLDIFTDNLYHDYKITQLWIFKDSKPIGLFLGLHYQKLQTIIDEVNDFAASIIGEMHLFTLPQFRGKGFATKAIPILENLMLYETLYPPCIIMQDDAYPLGKNLKKSLALPNNDNSGVCKQNRAILSRKYSEIIGHQNYLDILLKQYPELHKSTFLEKLNNNNIISKIKSYA